MATPIIQSTQTGPGAGTAGQGRNDLVLSVAVNFSDTESANSGATYSTTLLYRPHDSSAAITGAATSTPSFTPDKVGSYAVEFTATIGGRDWPVIEIYRVGMTNSGYATPAYDERNEYDGAANAYGWAPEAETWDRWIDSNVGTLLGNVTTLTASIASEATARAAADTSEATARAAAISAEATTRAAADSTLTTNVATNTTNIATNATAITTEATARAAAITSEASTRAAADSSEATTRAAADSSEATTRAAADTALDSRLTTAEGTLASGVLTPTTTFAGDVSGHYNTISVDKVKAKTVGTLSASQAVVINGSSQMVSTALGGDIAGTLDSVTVTQARGLKSATTTVSVSASAAPVAGYIVKATDGSTATWQAEGIWFGRGDNAGTYVLTPNTTTLGGGWGTFTASVNVPIAREVRPCRGVALAMNSGFIFDSGTYAVRFQLIGSTTNTTAASIDFKLGTIGGGYGYDAFLTTQTTGTIVNTPAIASCRSCAGNVAFVTGPITLYTIVSAVSGQTWTLWPQCTVQIVRTG